MSPSFTPPPIPECPAHLNNAERSTWHLDGLAGEDRKFRHRIFKNLPEQIHKAVANQYRQLYEATDKSFGDARQQANLYLLECQKDFPKSTVRLCEDDNNVILYAEECASKISAATCVNLSLESRYYEAIRIANFLGVELPKEKNITMEGAIARLRDPLWWRRRIRKIHGQKIEAAYIQHGFVHKNASTYISQASLQRRLGQKARNRKVLSDLLAINEIGDEFNLDELIQKSIANPKNRRNELMCRMAGFEKVARQLKHEALFLTVTCPSRMHARSYRTGRRNEKYDGTSPRDAQKYLQTLWTRIRAKLKRDGINIYGFRIAEPQHDATPHWHLLVFLEPRHTRQLNFIFRNYALADSPNERGAQKYRIKTVKIDYEKGTATGYVAKYVSKNIDGEYLERDLYGSDANHAALRVEAWASQWGIRQFQQIGGPPVTIWRELRRIQVAPEEQLEEARAAADSGDWGTFLELTRSILSNRKTQPLKIQREWDPEIGKYGEPKGYQIQGVSNGTHFVKTRLHKWRIIEPRILVILQGNEVPHGNVRPSPLEFCQ